MIHEYQHYIVDVIDLNTRERIYTCMTKGWKHGWWPVDRFCLVPCLAHLFYTLALIYLYSNYGQVWHTSWMLIFRLSLLARWSTHHKPLLTYIMNNKQTTNTILMLLMQTNKAAQHFTLFYQQHTKRQKCQNKRNRTSAQNHNKMNREQLCKRMLTCVTYMLGYK